MSSYFQVRLNEVGASTTRLLLHDSRLNTPRLLSPTLMPALNESGAFSFSLATGQRGYNQLRERTSYVDVYQDGANTALWSGRVSGIKDITTALRQYSCEGALSFLADSVQPLWQHNGTCQALIDLILGFHNSQVDSSRKIYRGVVDSTLDPNNLIVREQGTVPYPDTFTKLKDATFGSSTGGYVRVRRAADGLLYLDWTKEPGGLNTQKIRFGDNLVDFQQATTSTTIITACEPFGADIEQETGGPIPLALDANTPGATLLYTGPDNVGHYGFRDQETAGLYGQVCTSQRWEQVSLPANLLQRAADYVAAHKLVELTFSASAVDKHLISDASAFRVGDKVRVVVPPIGADQILTVQKMTIVLDRPDGWQINLGANKRRTFLDTLNQAQRTADQINEVVSSNARLGEEITEVRTSAEGAASAAATAQAKADAAQAAATKLAATALASYSWDGTMPLDGITWEETGTARTKSVAATDGALRANALISPAPTTAGNFWAHFRPGLMQIEQGTLYEVTVVVRVPSQTPSAMGVVYAGVDGVKCNANGTFNSFVNVNGANSVGSQHYFAASNSSAPMTSGLWTTFTGYFRQAGAGETVASGPKPDPMNPGRIHPSATHFWPHVLMAYSGKADLVQVSNVSVTAYPLSSAKLIQQANAAAQAAAQAAADAAAGAAADLAQSILTLTSLIEQTNTSLETTIGETYELRSSALTSYQQLQSTITQLSTSVTLNFETVNAVTQAINDALVSQFAALNVWVRFSLAGMDMGRTDSPITMNLSNTQLSFIQNGNVVAYISNNQLVITDAWVQGKCRIGPAGSGANYVWEVGPDQHLTLQRR